MTKSGPNQTGHDRQSPDKDLPTNINPLVVDTATAASSLAAGLVTAWRLIEERAYGNLSTMRITEDIKERRKAWGTELREQIKSGSITEDQAAHELREGIKKYAREMDQRFAEAGINNVADRYRLLRDHQKWEVAITSFAVASVALGSILLMSKNIFTGSAKQGGSDKSEPKR